MILATIFGGVSAVLYLLGAALMAELVDTLEDADELKDIPRLDAASRVQFIFTWPYQTLLGMFGSDEGADIESE